MIDFKSVLNDSQYRAVTYLGGPELVIAGAGSGKTRVLTYKLAYLLQQGYPAKNLLALTFTNKAAKEMKNRIKTLVGHRAAKEITVGTFHSVFRSFLVSEIAAGHFDSSYGRDFLIYDDKDTLAVLKSIIHDQKLREDFYDIAVVAKRISNAKNNMLSPDSYVHSSFFQKDCQNNMKAMDAIYKDYQNRLRQANAMDFDDLLLNLFLHFRKNEDRRLAYSQRFDYCLVDEYQDTNLIQKVIIMQLTNEKYQLCVVGDDAQSIYAFRGAVIGNILNFEEDFPGYKEFKLEENYRSTQTIVNASNSLIEKNFRQRQKNVFSNNILGDKITVFRTDSDNQESAYIASTIHDLVQRYHYSYGDFAILYRNNYLSRVIEKTLVSHRLRYIIYGGVGFFQRKEVKDLICYFRAIINPDDDLSMKRIINYPARGIGDSTLEKLVTIANNSGISLWRVISNPANYRQCIKKEATLRSIFNFVALLQSWRDLLSQNAADVVIRVIDDIDIITHLKKSDKDEQDQRVSNIYQLVSDVREYIEEQRSEDVPAFRLYDYLSNKVLLTDEDDKDKEKKEKNSVKLMTIHKSKGLEFPVVFVVGMDEDIFPHCSSKDQSVDIEEERRLCYVALTRAKEKLYLTGSNIRFINGRNVDFASSKFLFDIDSRYLNIINIY